MKISKKLMKAISEIANFKCDKMNCIDCPFLRTVKDTDICLSADMKIIQLSLLIEQGVYLNDNMTFIETPTGRSKYVCTVSYKNKNYAIKEYQNSGIVYCDDKADNTYPLRLALTTDDMNINYVMLKSNDFLVANLRYYFEHGCFRFKNLQCKECVLKLVSY